MEKNLFIPRNYYSFLLCLNIINKKKFNTIFINKKYFSAKAIESILYLKFFFKYEVLISYYSEQDKNLNLNYKFLEDTIKKKNITKVYSSNDAIEFTVNSQLRNMIEFNLICHGYGPFINIYIESLLIKKILRLFNKKNDKNFKYNNYYSLLNNVINKKYLLIFNKKTKIPKIEYFQQLLKKLNHLLVKKYKDLNILEQTKYNPVMLILPVHIKIKNYDRFFIKILESVEIKKDIIYLKKHSSPKYKKEEKKLYSAMIKFLNKNCYKYYLIPERINFFPFELLTTKIKPTKVISFNSAVGFNLSVIYKNKIKIFSYNSKKLYKKYQYYSEFKLFVFYLNKFLFKFIKFKYLNF
mgnify:FL=1